MNTIKIIISVMLLSLASTLILSCFEEDEMVGAPIPGDVVTSIISLGEDYTEQYYYDLSIQDFVATNSIEAWDLAFECSEQGWHVILNAAKDMRAASSGKTVFEEVKSPGGLNMTFDKSDGNLDSTAIGKWYFEEDGQVYSHKEVLVVNRGLGIDFASLGIKKMILDIQEGQYIIRFADLNGDNEQSFTLSKDPDYNFVYFSFDEGQVEIAPQKKDWSFHLTKYSTTLFTNEGLAYPYTVTGLKLNPYQVTAAIDTLDFESISLQDTSLYTFSNQQDIIGYDWKIYSFDEDKYEMIPNKHYLIKDRDKRYYKLRFIDFYDDLGTKGTITMEIARL